MREIKFRAWHKGEYNMSAPQMLYDDWNGECLLFAHQNQPVELMQYTGLKDKNGKEIYEGDIVKTDWATGQIIYEGDSFNIYLGVARNLPNGSCRNFIEYKDNWQGWEVIGNIKENPEKLT